MDNEMKEVEVESVLNRTMTMSATNESRVLPQDKDTQTS